jgi:hypothetical protein
MSQQLGVEDAGGGWCIPCSASSPRHTLALLDASAAADMLAWENSGFSIDASVRISLIDRDVPSYFQSLEHPHGGGWIMVGRAGRREISSLS